MSNSSLVESNLPHGLAPGIPQLKFVKNVCVLAGNQFINVTESKLILPE